MSGDGILLKRLPLVDPRGPHEQGALVRAFVDKAWRWRHEHQLKRMVIPRNVLRFGGAVKA